MKLVIFTLLFCAASFAQRSVTAPLFPLQPQFDIYYVELRNIGDLPQHVTLTVKSSGNYALDPTALLVRSFCFDANDVIASCPNNNFACRSTTQYLPLPGGGPCDLSPSLSCASAQKCEKSETLAPKGKMIAQFSIRLISAVMDRNFLSSLFLKVDVDEDSGEMKGRVISSASQKGSAQNTYYDHAAFQINGGKSF